MAGKVYVCRHCKESFIPYPQKPGYIDECPECLIAKAMEAEPQPESPSPQLKELWAYIAAHPVTVDLETGKPVMWKTRLELRQKLRRKKFSPEVVEKLISLYMAVVVEG
jgi:hypothetical protein